MSDRPLSRAFCLFDVADMVSSVINTHLREKSIDPETYWSLDQSIAWARLAVEDHLNSTMKWAKSSNKSYDYIREELLRHVHTNTSEQSLDNLTEDFFIELDPAVIMINELVDQCVADNPWRIWHSHYRADFVVLEADEDYRVAWFMEKYEAKEIAL